MRPWVERSRPRKRGLSDMADEFTKDVVNGDEGGKMGRVGKGIRVDPRQTSEAFIARMRTG